MTETLQIIQLIFSFLIIPVLGYVIRLERRLTKVETILEMKCKLWDGEDRRHTPQGEV